jgi:hypothetical protein
MPRVRCNYEGCIHLEGNFCTAGEIEIDQELGCITFSQVDEDEVAVVDDEIAETIAVEEEGEWEADDFEDEEEDEDLEEWDEDDDLEDEDESDEDGGGGWSAARSRRR